MKVIVDFREAARERRAGKGEYVYQLVGAMLPQLNTDEQLLLLVEQGQQVKLPVGSWTIKTIPARAWLWQAWVLLWLTFAKPGDLYFASTSVIIPALNFRIPTVTTLFDFTVWRFPKTHLSKAVRIEKLFMKAALQRSRRLLAISEFTKQEAIDLFAVSPDRIDVTLLAADPRFKPLPPTSSDIEAVKRKYALPERFILSLGTLEPRKNLSRLISAYTRIRHEIPSTKLVLAGATGWGDQADLVANPDIVRTGYVDDEDRLALYNASAAFVFPSLYEGFGLPPLEAMACGVPVVASRSASLPEVVDTSALMVDPADTNQLSRSLVQVITDVALRQRLSASGPTRAANFSWRTTASLTLAAFRTSV